MGTTCYEAGKNRVDLKPEYIQEIMEANAKKDDEINSLKKEIEGYKTKNSVLKSNNKQLENACSQYQLMLQYNNNISNQNNINNNNFTQNNFNNRCCNINNNTFNNNQVIGGNNCMYNFCNTFKSKIKNSKIITIIFRFDGGPKYPIATYGTCRLMDVFCLVINKNRKYQDLTKLSFYYCSNNITKHFSNNDEVNVLNLPNNCIIDVIKIQNIS